MPFHGNYSVRPQVYSDLKAVSFEKSWVGKELNHKSHVRHAAEMFNLCHGAICNFLRKSLKWKDYKQPSDTDSQSSKQGVKNADGL